MRYQDNTRYTSDSPNGRGHNRANLLKALRFVLRRSYLELIDHSRREILSRVSGKLDGETERASAASSRYDEARDPLVEQTILQKYTQPSEGRQRFTSAFSLGYYSRNKDNGHNGFVNVILGGCVVAGRSAANSRGSQ